MTRLSRLKPLLDVLATVAMGIAAVLLIWRLAGASSEVRKPDVKNQVPTVEPMGAVELDTSGAHVKGVPSAPAVIVEFTDFECPFCARHAAETFDKIGTLVTAGKVAYIVKHFPLVRIHSSAMAAATAAECAGRQGRFWDMHHAIFARSGSLRDADWNALASDAGLTNLDARQFEQCVRDPQLTLRRIQRDQTDGEMLGVSSTPTFFVGTRSTNGKVKLTQRIRGAAPLHVFESGLKSVAGY